MKGPVLKAIQYLSADYQPTISQTPAGITKLVKELAPIELTKAEKLQVVNLAPTEPVELYVVCRIPYFYSQCYSRNIPASFASYLSVSFTL